MRPVWLVCGILACRPTNKPSPPWASWQAELPNVPRMASDPQGRWVVLCRPTNDGLAPVLYVGDAAGQPIDDLRGSDRNGHLVVRRAGADWLVDVVTGAQSKIEGFEALSYGQLAYRRGGNLVVRRLDEATEIELPLMSPFVHRELIETDGSVGEPVQPAGRWCGPFPKDVPCVFDGHAARKVTIVSTRSGLAREVDDVVPTPIPRDLIARRVDGAVVLESPEDGFELARLPKSCDATVLATTRDTALTACRSERPRARLWIHNRKGSTAIGDAAIGTTSSYGDDLVMVSDVLVDLRAGTATRIAGTMVRPDRRGSVVWDHDRLMIDGRVLVKTPLFHDVHGVWPIVSVGPFVFDLAHAMALGYARTTTIAVRADGRVLTLTPRVRERYVTGERLSDVLRWETVTPL
jgi:hypothetical protein